MNRKVLLLNPPGSHRYSRDYYCGHIVKGNYYWQPIDLLVISGLLKNHFELEVLDCIAGSIDTTEALSFIDNFKPYAIVMQTSFVSWDEDINFINSLSHIFSGPLLINGDYPRSNPEEIMKKHSLISAALQDFTDPNLVRYLKNDITNLHSDSTNNNTFSYPVPRHDLFDFKKYHHPMAQHHPFATVISSFSCPYSCGYCFFEKIPHKLRSLKNFKDEINYLVNELGIRELFINDPCFGVNIEHSLEICKILKEFPKISWICGGMRTDQASYELLTKMKESGCHLIQFGVETSTLEVLSVMNKNISNNQTTTAFQMARDLSIKTLAHFILGLYGETEESINGLIDFSLKLNPDYASYNLATPIPNTSFCELLKQNKISIDKNRKTDISADWPIWDNPSIAPEKIYKLKKRALKKFYLRPSYVIKRIASIKTFYQLKSNFSEGFSLIRRLRS